MDYIILEKGAETLDFTISFFATNNKAQERRGVKTGLYSLGVDDYVICWKDFMVNALKN